MAHPRPVVRYLILCDDVQPNPESPHKVNVTGLSHAIHSLEEPPFPLVLGEICVFGQLTECRGTADVRVEIVQASSQKTIFQTRTKSVEFSGNDPLKLYGLTFRIRNLRIPEKGLYHFQLLYNGEVLEQKAVAIY